MQEVSGITGAPNRAQRGSCLDPRFTLLSLRGWSRARGVKGREFPLLGISGWAPGSSGRSFSTRTCSVFIQSLRYELMRIFWILWALRQTSVFYFFGSQLG